MSCPECRGLSGYHFRYGHCWWWEVSVRRRPFPQRICCLVVLTRHTQKAEMTTTSLFLKTGGRDTMKRKQRSGRRKAERWNLPAEGEEQVQGSEAPGSWQLQLGSGWSTLSSSVSINQHLPVRGTQFPTLLFGKVCGQFLGPFSASGVCTFWNHYGALIYIYLSWFSGGSHLQRSLRKGPRLHSPDQYKSPSS